MVSIKAQSTSPQVGLEPFKALLLPSSSLLSGKSIVGFELKLGLPVMLRRAACCKAACTALAVWAAVQAQPTAAGAMLPRTTY